MEQELRRVQKLTWSPTLNLMVLGVVGARIDFLCLSRKGAGSKIVPALQLLISSVSWTQSWSRARFPFLEHKLCRVTKLTVSKTLNLML